MCAVLLGCCSHWGLVLYVPSTSKNYSVAYLCNWTAAQAMHWTAPQHEAKGTYQQEQPEDCKECTAKFVRIAAAYAQRALERSTKSRQLYVCEALTGMRVVESLTPCLRWRDRERQHRTREADWPAVHPHQRQKLSRNWMISCLAGLYDR